MTDYKNKMRDLCKEIISQAALHNFWRYNLDWGGLSKRAIYHSIKKHHILGDKTWVALNLITSYIKVSYSEATLYFYQLFILGQ